MIQEQYPEDRDDFRRTETAGEHRSPHTPHEPGHDPREPREFYNPREPESSEYRGTETREPRGLREPRESPGPRAYGERDYTEPRDYEEREYHTDISEQPAEIQTVFSTSGINILAGLWLILAPFVLGYATVEAALWNSIIVGVAVGIMAIIRVINPDEYEGVSWVNFVLGIWLLVSPFVLGLSTIEPLVWNNIIVGVVILALAATSALATRRLHHHPTAGIPSGRRRGAGRTSRSRTTSRF